MKASIRSKRIVISIIVVLLLLIAAVPAMGAQDTIRVFVQYAPGHANGVRQALENGNAHFIYDFPDLEAYVVSMPAASLNGIQNNPHVVMVEEDGYRQLFIHQADALDVTLDPTIQTVPYGVDAVQARDVWDANRDGVFDAGAPTGADKTICIIDTGFYAGHEDLAGINVIGGTAQVDAPWSVDGNGHGSHVAGTIAAVNNSLGVVGTSPGVSLYIVKIFGNDGLWSRTSDLIAATNLCRDGGADVISMSLGGDKPNNREKKQFDNLYASGILSVAAAGNDYSAAINYPAAYPSVVSVAAVDEANLVADFSNQDAYVEIAAPGVGVLSTVPYIEESSLTVDGASYSANHIEYSPYGVASGALVDGGICDTVGAWAGQIVLCQRGTISFYDKVMNVQNGGGAAAIIYNHEPGNFLGTLGEGATSAIVGISLSMEDGQYLVANRLGLAATVSSTYEWPANGYEYYDGTSMATPHVAAAAALAWSGVPGATNAQVREALTATAMDLGAAGRDNAYGYGLVQAYSAMQYLIAGGGGGGGGDIPLVLSLSTDKAAYVNGETVVITATVTDGSAPVAGAAVQVVLTTPKNKVYTFNGVTDASGMVAFTQKINLNRDGKGTFVLAGSASLSGYLPASATATFTAN